MSAASLMGFSRGLAVVWRLIQKKHFRKKKLIDDFGGIWTPDLCCSFITDTTLIYSPDWNLNLVIFSSFIEDKPLSYSVNGDRVVFWSSQRWLSGVLEHYQHICEYLSILRMYLRSNVITRNQVNFDPDTKTNSFSTPRHKTKSIPTPQLNSSHVRSPTLKSSQYRPPRQKPSQFRCSH